jgi:putative ABC transport system permease protein
MNQKKAMGLMVASIAVGTALAASLITISLEINGKVSKELRSFGANIIVEPKVEGLADISGQRRYLCSGDIIKTKTIFWRHNIIGVAPFLETDASLSVHGRTTDVGLIGAWYEKHLPLPGENISFPAGIKTVSPWWYLSGSWPNDRNGIVIGTSLAAQLGIRQGDTVSVDGNDLKVTGILETGGVEDGQGFLDLEALQSLKGMEGKISRVLVSALTTPMDDFAYKDPNTMSKTEYEKWYCTGYVTSISKQIEEVFIGSRTKPIWQVAETEGKVLDRLNILIYMLCITALAASAIGVSTTMIMTLLRRIEEIGLMKAIGAHRGKVITIFLSEGLIIGLIGGILGYLLSLGVAQVIGTKVFNAGLEQRAILFPIAVANALIIAFAGTILPIRRALQIKPSIVLKGAE